MRRSCARFRRMSKTMNDLQNETNEYREDMRLRPYRREFCYSYSPGVFPTCELAVKRPDILRKIVISASAEGNEGVLLLKRIAAENNVPFVTDDKTLARIYPKENVYAAGVFEKYTSKLSPSNDHVVMVDPMDKGNMGTVMRTMTAFGIRDLAVIRPCCDVFDPKTVRASMGAVFSLNVEHFDSFAEYETEFKKDRKFYPFMLDGRPMSSVTPDASGPPVSLIFGNESSGLPGSFSKVGEPVRIVHLDTVDSLNLPSAAAIGIYYFTSKRFG